MSIRHCNNVNPSYRICQSLFSTSSRSHRYPITHPSETGIISVTSIRLFMICQSVFFGYVNPSSVPRVARRIIIADRSASDPVVPSDNRKTFPCNVNPSSLQYVNPSSSVYSRRPSATPQIHTSDLSRRETLAHPHPIYLVGRLSPVHIRSMSSGDSRPSTCNPSDVGRRRWVPSPPPPPPPLAVIACPPVAEVAEVAVALFIVVNRQSSIVIIGEGRSAMMMLSSDE